MKRTEALISDADGTLVDTVRLIRHGQFETAKLFLLQHGLDETDIPSYEDYELIINRMVGGPARDTLEQSVRLLFADTPHKLSGMDFDELHEMLNPVQDALAPEFIKSYQGLSGTLLALGDAGIKLAIFTSGTSYHIVRNFGIALPELGLSELHRDRSTTDRAKLSKFTSIFSQYYGIQGFSVITAGDTKSHKPNPDSLLLAMKQLGTDPNKSAVLGDHSVDMKTAINAGVDRRIGITHGFDNRETLVKSGATTVIDSLDDLIASL